MGGEHPKGGGVFLGHSPFWGGDIPRLFVPRGRYTKEYRPLSIGGRISWGGVKSHVTMAWAKSSTFLKILSCPPKYEFAPQMPPPPQCAATACTFDVCIRKVYLFYPPLDFSPRASLICEFG